MEWLNYHHLFYFWTVVRAGSITQAAAHLRLAQATISSQIKALEESLGEPLLVRAGRRLQPTAAGQVVFRYADEIFSLGRELREALAGRAVRPRPLTGSNSGERRARRVQPFRRRRLKTPLEY